MDENKNLSEPAEEPEEDIAEVIEDKLADEAVSDEDDAVSEYNDAATEYAALEEELIQTKEEIESLKDKYMRLMAEYDNYRKRTAKEKTEIYSNASAKCIENLLPVIDSFERSREHECADESFKEGVDMIFTQLQDFLGKMNVTEVEGVGAEFDPNVHNAIQQQEDTDYASNHVCAVFQKGYKIGDKLIRPAMVAVAV